VRRDPEEEVLRYLRRARGDVTFTQLVNYMVGRGYRDYEASKAVYELWVRGKLDLIDPDPPRTFGAYALSVHSLWFWFWVAVVLVTDLIVLAAPARPPFIYARYVLGSVLVLYVPGFSLIEALYPKREELEPLERFALSVGLSLALVPLVGLVLNYTPWGIRLVPVLVSISALSLVLLVAALIRKYSYHIIPLLAGEGGIV